MILCKCGREFEKEAHMKLHAPHCKGKLYCKNPNCNIQLIGKGPNLYCSSKCYALHTTPGRSHSIETREKISKSLGGNGTVHLYSNKCLNCGNQIKSKKYCSIDCQNEYRYNNEVEEWLIDPSKFKQPRRFMKKWLFKKGGEQCHKCGWKERNEYTENIPVEMHHEDGDYTNNFPDNLDLLCPNCHSLTSTYRFGNKRSKREYHKKYYREHYQKNKPPVAKLDMATDF